MNTQTLSKLSIALKRKHADAIKDIILFGSTVRGKNEPGDTDILLLFKDRVDKDIEYEFKRSASIEDLSIISKTEETFYAASFDARDSIIFEGYSLLRKERLSRTMGFDSLGIFIYSTKSLNNAKKTLFYYALNGRRGTKGRMGSLDAIKLSDNILAVPLERVEETKEFFSSHHIEFTYVPSLIPSRLAKKHIIGKVI